MFRRWGSPLSSTHRASRTQNEHLLGYEIYAIRSALIARDDNSRPHGPCRGPAICPGTGNKRGDVVQLIRTLWRCMSWLFITSRLHLGRVAGGHCYPSGSDRVASACRPSARGSCPPAHAPTISSNSDWPFTTTTIRFALCPPHTRAASTTSISLRLFGSHNDSSYIEQEALYDKVKTVSGDFYHKTDGKITECHQTSQQVAETPPYPPSTAPDVAFPVAISPSRALPTMAYARDQSGLGIADNLQNGSSAPTLETSMAAITDGTSNTIMLGEFLHGDNSNAYTLESDVVARPWTGGTTLLSTRQADFAATIDGYGGTATKTTAAPSTQQDTAGSTAPSTTPCLTRLPRN